MRIALLVVSISSWINVTAQELPSHAPSDKPSIAPSRAISPQPSVSPSERPTTFPSHLPSNAPSFEPTQMPSKDPSKMPSFSPSSYPSGNPSSNPSGKPSSNPSGQPSSRPSSSEPSSYPSSQPSSIPSQRPTSSPTIEPSNHPSRSPSTMPSIESSDSPSERPSSIPSSRPTIHPSLSPTSLPSMQLTIAPSTIPTLKPSVDPSSLPTTSPTLTLSSDPSIAPSSRPTMSPSVAPSHHPSYMPSINPTMQSSRWPSNLPSKHPSIGPNPAQISVPTGIPRPSVLPSYRPTVEPFTQVSDAPTTSMSFRPSQKPTKVSSLRPSLEHSESPALQLQATSKTPSIGPSLLMSGNPIASHQPSIAMISNQPSQGPSEEQREFKITHLPSRETSLQPSMKQSEGASNTPSVPTVVALSLIPTVEHSATPSVPWSSFPSQTESNVPSPLATAFPSSRPSISTVMDPLTTNPTETPSSQVFVKVTSSPSKQKRQDSNWINNNPTCSTSFTASDVTSDFSSPLPTIGMERRAKDRRKNQARAISNLDPTDEESRLEPDTNRAGHFFRHSETEMDESPRKPKVPTYSSMGHCGSRKSDNSSKSKSWNAGGTNPTAGKRFYKSSENMHKSRSMKNVRHADGGGNNVISNPKSIGNMSTERLRKKKGNGRRNPSQRYSHDEYYEDIRSDDEESFGSRIPLMSEGGYGRRKSTWQMSKKSGKA